MWEQAFLAMTFVSNLADGETERQGGSRPLPVSEKGLDPSLQEWVPAGSISLW